MFVRVLLGLTLLITVISQKVGTQQAEFHMPINWQNCSSLGVCATVNGALVIDANWRWLHQADVAQNCFTASWNCGGIDSCTANCYL
jgi:cellulose 1,4-beta-cellobiosidase